MSAPSPEDRKMVGWTIRHSTAMVALIGCYLDHSELCKTAGTDPTGCKACIFDGQVNSAIKLWLTPETAESQNP